MPVSFVVQNPLKIFVLDQGEDMKTDSFPQFYACSLKIIDIQARQFSKKRGKFQTFWAEFCIFTPIKKAQKILKEITVYNNSGQQNISTK